MGHQADLAARADRLDDEAGARRLRPADTGAIAVHHELEVEKPVCGIKPANRVAAANDGPVIAHDRQSQVLAGEIFEPRERWAGELDPTHVRRDVLDRGDNEG